jgi:hypothetical protein
MSEAEAIEGAKLGDGGNQLLCFYTAPTTMPPINSQVLFAHDTNSSHCRKQNQMRLL